MPFKKRKKRGGGIWYSKTSMQFLLDCGSGQFDLRQRKIKNTFQAHESAVKCLAVDCQEEYYVTGSAEGDIKVPLPSVQPFLDCPYLSQSFGFAISHN